MNALPISLWVICRSLIRMLAHVWVCTPFGLNPKGYYKSELNSPLEPHKEEEGKATPLGCEPENLVEEKATLVSLWEDGKMKNMYYKVSDFCRSHDYFHPHMDHMVVGENGCCKNQNLYHPCSSSYHLPEVILRWPSPPPNFLLHTQSVWFSKPQFFIKI